MLISVVGLGYIGLPTSLMLASNGATVVGVDTNSELVAKLKAGKITFEEEGLSELLAKTINKTISFSDSYVKADVYIVATPTHCDSETKMLDPSYVIAACETILKICDRGVIIVIESTVSPGTIDKYIRPLFTSSPFELGIDIHLAHAPERVIPGSMVHELQSNSRTIGADSLIIAEKVKEIYTTFCSGDIILTNIRTAEMSKVVENTFRDVNIAFANELARICRHAELDVYEVIRIANMHPRVNILQPGPGVGGHCIPVDPWFLISDYPQLTNLIKAARQVNEAMPAFVLERINSIMKQHSIESYSRVGIYGVTYKENIDDVRESPTRQLLNIAKLSYENEFKVYDPFVNNFVVGQSKDFEEFLSSVDLVVIMIGHTHIKQNLDKLKDKIVLDTRNICTFSNRYTL